MTTSTPRMVGAGAIFIDDIVLPTGQTHMAVLGGGVVHALMGAAVWGERPGIVAPVGRSFPPHSMEQLEQHLDTRGLYQLDVPQMRAWQLFEFDGGRREIYRVNDIQPFIPGAQPEQLPAAYRGSRGYYLLQGYEGIRRWCAALSGFILWEPLQQVMLPQHRADMRQALAECPIDLISPNLVEARAVYGLDEPEALIEAMFNDGAKRVALRMGAAGSIVADRETGERYRIAAVPVANIVDQTGAGNTYCGALLQGLVENCGLRAAAVRASVSASFCLEQIGALNPALIAEAERNRRFDVLMHSTVG